MTGSWSACRAPSHGGSGIGQCGGQPFARLPQLLAEPVGLAPRQLRVAIGDDQHRRPHLRHVRVGETRQQAGGQDTWLLFEGAG